MIKKTILIILLLSSVVYGQYPVRDSLVVTGGVRTTERIWHKPTSGAGTFLLGSAGFSSIRGDSSKVEFAIKNDGTWNYPLLIDEISRAFHQIEYSDFTTHILTGLNVTGTTTIGTATETAVFNVGGDSHFEDDVSIAGDLDMNGGDMGDVGRIQADSLFGVGGVLHLGGGSDIGTFEFSVLAISTDYWDISYTGNFTGLANSSITGSLTLTSAAGFVSAEAGIFNGPSSKEFSDITTVTTATATLYSLATLTGYSYRIDATYMAIQDDGVSWGGGHRRFYIKNLAGTLSELQEAELEDSDNSGGDIYITGTVSGTNYLIDCASINSETWEWSLRLDIITCEF